MQICLNLDVCICIYMYICICVGGDAGPRHSLIHSRRSCDAGPPDSPVWCQFKCRVECKHKMRCRTADWRQTQHNSGEAAKHAIPSSQTPY